MPVFNGEKGFARALDSVIGQDYPNLEIIISDNASTDTTQEICERYVLKDARVKYSRLDKNFGAIENERMLISREGPAIDGEGMRTLSVWCVALCQHMPTCSPPRFTTRTHLRCS